MSAGDVAEWMLSQLKEHGELDQESAVDEIISRFGDQFNYENEDGNPAIGRDVLRAFRRLTGDAVVWDRTERLWRFRALGDAPGRTQDD